MRSGISPKGLRMKQKVLSASAKLFLEYGYAGTSSKMVSKMLGISNGSPFFHYGNKEGVLLDLVKRMFTGQFQVAGDLSAQTEDPLLLYGVETALQMHIAEQSEPLRDLYVSAYTLPLTSQYIFSNMVPKLTAIFGPYLPDTSYQTVYEFDLASAGVTRNFMIIPCSETFPLEQKVRKLLLCLYRIFAVPPETFEPIIEAVASMDLAPVAAAIIERTVQQVDQEFDDVMETDQKIKHKK